jgi:16S rRNA processing protein RimM
MMHDADLILLGKITGTHGIKGQLKVFSYSGERDTFLSLSSVVLKEPSGKTETFAVAAAAVQGKKVLLSLEGFADINKAERLLGREVYAYSGQLPALSDGEYYWFQLEGLQVVTVQGDVLGRLTSLIPTGSNDVYVVTAGEREYMIPAVEDVVVEIDLTGRIMKVDPPEGLLDL